MLELTNLKTPQKNAEINLLKKIYEKKAEFYNFSNKNTQIKQINEFVKTNSKNFKHFVILGIGGSALGAKCLQQALAYEDEKLIIIDNIDPDLISKIEKQINPAQTLFIVISKSGKTIETIELLNYFSKKAPKKNFIFITGEKNNALPQNFIIPENICGRFSILTPVGLLPAKLLNIKTEKIIKGAKNQLKNPRQAFQFAYTQIKSKKPINVIMPYSEKLKNFAQWYKQLLSESIGKQGKGITPTSAMGVTDQHSQLQLYNQGPNDKLIIFLEVEKFKSKNKNFAKLMRIEKKATEKALTKNQRKTITIKIKEINETTIGELIMFFELSVAFLGEMLKINAFDQPGVELTKKYISQLLNK